MSADAAGTPGDGQPHDASVRRLGAFGGYALLFPFLLSGAAALIAQLGWLRILTVEIGGSASALNIVLITFMAGLAIGAALARRLQARLQLRLVLIYAVLEGFLSIYILLSGMLIRGVGTAFNAISPSMGHESLLENLARLVVTGATLLPPTVAMGMTTPILIAATVSRLRDTASKAGTLYGINTLGAATGALVAASYLILRFGITRSLWMAAGLNAIAALAAFVIAMRFERTLASSSSSNREAVSVEPAAASDPSGATPGLWIYGLIAAAGGFLGMAFEVLFARLLAFVIGSSYFSQSVSISGFLAGIVIGSFAIGWIGRRTTLRGSALPFLICGFGLATIAAAIAFETLPQRLDIWFRSEMFSGVSVLVLKLIATVSIVVLPAIASGMLLPYLIHMLSARVRDVGAASSRVLFWNTTGSVLGVALTGYLLIGWFGVRTALFGMTTLSFVLAGFAALVCCRASALRGVALACAGLGVVVGIGLTATKGPRPIVLDSLYYTQAGSPGVLHYAEDEVASVTAVKFPDGGRGLMINGLVNAQQNESEIVQGVVVDVAMLTMERPESLYLAGIGSGRTAGVAGLYPGLQTTAVEISSAVIESLPALGSYNYHLLENPAVQAIHGDARHYLRATPQRFDLIGPDVYISTATGTAYLYNQEFFEMCAERVRPGGRVVLNVYLQQAIDRTIAAGFANAFPHVDFVRIPLGYDLLIGSNEPITYPRQPWLRWADQPDLIARTQQLGITDQDSLAPFVIGRRADLLEFLESQGARPSTDDHPTVDYLHLADPKSAWQW